MLLNMVFDLVEIRDTGEMLRNLLASASYSEAYTVFAPGTLALSTLDIMTSCCRGKRSAEATQLVPSFQPPEGVATQSSSELLFQRRRFRQTALLD